MKRMNLTREERAIEKALLRGDYKPASQAEFNRVADMIARRRKDAVLNIRINSYDLASIKKKAKARGIPYQSLVSELIHIYAA